tara:strand:- start:516 stop:716 length:201 start_codon:yes stop_codon:yes gene_type:complete
MIHEDNHKTFRSNADNHGKSFARLAGVADLGSAMLMGSRIQSCAKVYVCDLGISVLCLCVNGLYEQ